MCNYKIWVQPRGDAYVLECTECNTYQVRLYGAAFIFEPSEFIQFKNTVQAFFNSVANNTNEDPIIIPTFNQGIDLLLSEASLEELYYLLDAADTEMRTARIVSQFN